LTRAKLSRHELFGCLESVPFREIMRRAEQE
jgi:hypothetical protein